MTRFTPQWLQAGLYAASVDRRLVGALWPVPASSGCLVTAGSGMTVNVAAGQVAVPTQNGTGTTLCTSDAVEVVTLAAAPASGSNRYDLITCQPRGNDLDGGANNDFIFTNVTGTAAASPTVPATPAGAVALAQVYVPGGSASVTAGNITDVRPYGLSLAPSIPAFANAAARVAAWPNPPLGAMWIQNDTSRLVQWFPGLSLAYTPFAVLASQNRVTAAGPQGTEGDVGVQITIVVPPNRRIRLEAGVRGMNMSVASAVGFLHIREGATEIYGVQYPATTGLGGPGGTFGVTVTPTGGTHTYKLTIEGVGGTATAQASATSPIWLEATDMGTI